MRSSVCIAKVAYIATVAFVSLAVAGGVITYAVRDLPENADGGYIAVQMYVYGNIALFSAAGVAFLGAIGGAVINNNNRNLISQARC